MYVLPKWMTFSCLFVPYGAPRCLWSITSQK